MPRRYASAYNVDVESGERLPTWLRIAAIVGAIVGAVLGIWQAGSCGAACDPMPTRLFMVPADAAIFAFIFFAVVGVLGIVLGSVIEGIVSVRKRLHRWRLNRLTRDFDEIRRDDDRSG